MFTNRMVPRTRLALIRLLAALLVCLGSRSALGATTAFTLVSTTPTAFPNTTTAQTSVSQTIQLTTTRAVIISSISIPQSVNAHQEFTLGAITGCATDGVTSTASGATCNIPVTFSPTYAGARAQTLSVTDSTGLVFSVGLNGYANGPQGALAPGSVATVGGVSGGYYYSGDGGPASAARYSAPYNIAVDATNNLYMADEVSGNIRVIYQGGAALACLIEIEEPTLFGLALGSTSCAGATSAPVAGDVYTLGGDPTQYGTVTTHVKGSDDNRIATTITATTSTLNSPAGVAVDSYGNIVIGDYNAYKVRVIYNGGAAMACLIEIEEPTLFGLTATATSCAGATSAPIPGYIYTLVGTGTPNATGDGGKATLATMTYAAAVGISPAGDIYLSDDSTQAARTSRIRVVYNGGALAATLIALEAPGTTPVLGNIYKIAGGLFSSSGDGALAASGGILYMRGLVLDSDGNIIFTDESTTSGSLTAKVRVVYAGGTRMAAIIAGENAGITALQGYMYTIGGSNTTGTTTTYVDNTLATSATMNTAYSLNIDPAGDIYVSDYGNYLIRRISASDFKMTTFIGLAKQGTTNGNALTTATLWNPYGIAFGSSGTLFFTDPGVYRIRNNSITAAPITFTVAAPVGNVSETEVVYESNTGTTPLTLTAITPSTNFAVVTSGSTVYSDCTGTTVLAPGATCAIGIVMKPITGGTLTGTLTVYDNSLNITGNSQAVALTGTSAIQTNTTLSSSSLTADLGAPIIFTAVVAITAGQNTTGAPTLTGNVTFTDGTTSLGIVAIDANGNAPLPSISTLAAGTHTITASFVPTVAGYSNSSAKLTETVTAPAFSVTTSTAGVAVITGQTVIASFAVISVGGYKGTVTASCMGQPADITCAFAPTSVTFTAQDNTLPITLTIGTTGGPTASLTGPSLLANRTGITLAGLLGASMLLLWPRRRRMGTLLLILLGIGLASTLSGCGNSSNSAARGTFNINAVFTDGTTSITVPVTVSVLGKG